MQRALISWSGGKDSYWALRKIIEAGSVEPAGLLTTYNEATRRIPIHEVPLDAIERHAAALKLPLRAVPLPWPCGNEEYLTRLRAVWRAAADEGIEYIVFGDVHLADIRRFREEALDGSGLTPLFPLWQMNPAELAEEIIAGGVEARITAVDSTRLSPGLIGRRFNRELVHSLPAGVDPCGENGEFHTLVTL